MSLGVRLWAGGRVLVGGSPWKVSTLAPSVQDLVLRLFAAGAAGIPVSTPGDRAALRVLLDRGFAERAPGPATSAAAEDVDIVVPVLDDAARLRELLRTLPEGRVLVVDDGSADPRVVKSVAQAANARLLRHEANRGPAAARNTGLKQGNAPFVAFIDADCRADRNWPAGLLGHFEDPAVAAVAPRIRPLDGGHSLLERYEDARSSLDMGGQPSLVRPGARLGFVPSAALIVRRAALERGGFDGALRLGEDVDLVWRLAEAGWLIRYDPSVTVRHGTRTRLGSWLQRKKEYGSSAPALEDRHPGNLAPARPSAWSVLTLLLVAGGQPAVGALVQVVPFVILARKFRSVPHGGALAALVTTQGLVADASGIGQALRREWWPAGTVILVTALWSRPARVAALMMLIPLALEWVERRPALDPLRYALLRLVDDAAYGSGVIESSLAIPTVRTLLPAVKGLGRRASRRT